MFIFDLTNLQILLIGSNNLKEISDSICKLKNLEELHILSSSIKKLPELKNLKELILIDTKIKNKDIFV